MWHAWRRRGRDPRFGGMLDGKNTVGKPRRNWENNIEIDRMGCSGLDLSG